MTCISPLVLSQNFFIGGVNKKKKIDEIWYMIKIGVIIFFVVSDSFAIVIYMYSSLLNF